jgi:RNA polymerase-associated protein LEO1
MTLQMATNATEQHEIRPNPMAPPQLNPPKPTAMGAATRGRKPQQYNVQDEQFTYLASGNRHAYGVRLTNKFTAGVKILPTAKKDTIEDIEATMAAIQARHRAQNADVGIRITKDIIDPEKVKAEAMKQEREAERRLRKAERDGEKTLKFGRAGRSGGLTIDDLEGSGRPRQQRGAPKNARRSRRDSLSDEEEEMYGRRGGSQDNYDMGDDFIVGSEEDLDGSDEDAEGEDDIDAVIERNERAQRTTSPKRPRPEDEEKQHASPVSRHKRRRVVSDDEDEE